MNANDYLRYIFLLIIIMSILSSISSGVQGVKEQTPVTSGIQSGISIVSCSASVGILILASLIVIKPN